MKNLLFVIWVVIISNTSCERDSNKLTCPACPTAKIIWYSCGGTVLQLLDSSNIGETWSNFFETPIIEYKDCVLAGNLTNSKLDVGDIISFNYKVVDLFSSGIFCGIGGLPKTKIEITDLFEIK
jgi:hypothetical protein